MQKENFIFDYSSLTDKEKSLYDNMTDKQKASFEKNWISLKKQESKVAQAKAKMNKIKKTASEKERKERTRHLIQIGGIVDKYVKIEDLDAFDAYIKQYANAIKRTQVRPSMKEAPHVADPVLTLDLETPVQKQKPEPKFSFQSIEPEGEAVLPSQF